MKNTLKRMLRETAAQDLAEYGIALAIVGAAAAAAAVTIATNSSTLWTRALQALVIALLRP